MARRNQKYFITDIEERVESTPSDFVPYTYHYDQNTLLTKNGELIQIIKIPSFLSEQTAEAKTSIRDLIRKVLSNAVTNNEFALWVNIIRDETDISPKIEPVNYFSNIAKSAWNEVYGLNTTYANELYITLISPAPLTPFLNFKTFLRRLLPNAELSFITKFLEEAKNKIYSATETILEQLEELSPKRLGLYKNQNTGIYYSEILSFLGRIVNFDFENQTVEIADISETLTQGRAISFGFNSITLKARNHNLYGSILTIKDHPEIQERYLDSLLQLPCEFLITETFSYISKKDLDNYFATQEKFLNLTEDKNIGEISGLSNIISKNDSADSAFGEHQVNIALTAEDKTTLEKNIKLVINSLKEIGIVAVREDILTEDCFWAQLPANFEFLKRKTPIRSNLIGNYSFQYGFPTGKKENNHWGEYVTTLYNPVNSSPYFFNFHIKNNGHTLVTGSEGMGKTTLINFLAAQSCKYKCNIVYLESGTSSEIFIRGLGGNYHKVSKPSELDLTTVSPGSPDIYGISYEKIAKDGNFNSEISKYLQKIINLLDGHPTIIVIEGLINTLSIAYSMEEFNTLLQQAADRNAILIFDEKGLEDLENKTFMQLVLDLTPTKIFLPRSDEYENLGGKITKFYSLSKREAFMLSSLDKENREFLLKHGNESVILEAVLDGQNFLLSVLSANKDHTKKMNDAISNAGNVPQKWLNLLKEKLDVVAGEN